MNKAFKKSLKNAMTMGILCFLATVIATLERGELDLHRFLHFNLPTLFIVTIGSFTINRFFIK